MCVEVGSLGVGLAVVSRWTQKLKILGAGVDDDDVGRFTQHQNYNIIRTECKNGQFLLPFGFPIFDE